LEALKDKEPKVRSSAAESLGSFSAEAKQTIPVLLESIGDKNLEVRRAAILALGRLGKGNEKVEEAIGKYVDDPDRPTKVDAIVAMANLGKVDDSAIPTIMEALASKEEATAKSGARVLGNLGTKNPDKVLPVLMEALEKGKDPLPRNAVRVLRQMRARAVPALPQISELYDKVDQSTRVEITEAILAIDTKGDYAIPTMIKALNSPQSKERREALIGLLRFRNKTELFLDPLIGRLKDKDPENQLLVVGILRGLGPQAKKAVPNLIELTAESNTNLPLRNAAIGALSSFTPPTPEMLQTLDKLIKDKDMRVRLATVGALRRIGYLYPDKATPLLKSGLEVAPDEQTKKAITSALERLNRGTGKASSSPRDKKEGKQLPSG
jgi:HEAT repeat protein